MDGLIPFVLKALKKKKTMKHYRSLSSSSGHLHVDVTEPSPRQGCFFMTPQHPKAPRWHDGDGDLFMTPQHPRAARWHDHDDGNGEPAAATAPVAATPFMERAKSANPQRRRLAAQARAPPAMEEGSGRSFLGGK